MREVESTTIDIKRSLFRDNLDPIVLADIEDKMIGQIAEFVKDQFPTFDWRWDDHSEMSDKAVTSLFLVKNDIVQICENDPNKIQELIRILEYIIEEEYGE
ncbi:hypothetical protein A0128_00885 [Leptospira tipperaryensis]|uniref:Uncharacterized protein n=1 Tax=Leptospira tipperaryensis TaxID=2564040 RepID=A0A1D7USH4_9LEPT|nr:hypothetical protein [Leptospira tipperaryensis]AOP32557.1 hypothetical protein A0128_00885 [Leptospira tipperaryensis]